MMHHDPGPLDADRARRLGRVRERVDPRPHRRRTRPRGGARYPARLRSIVIFWISLCLYTHTALSQTTPDDIIIFDRIKLTLGMPQRTVMTILAPEFDLVNVGGTGFLWHVQSKIGNNYVGSLRFEDGKLVVIQKRWGTLERQKAGFDFTRNLYLVLDQLPKALLSSCAIKLIRNDQPSIEDLFIQFFCGKKLITVAALRSPFSLDSTIEEVLK
jgi:hypothetical protein